MEMRSTSFSDRVVFSWSLHLSVFNNGSSSCTFDSLPLNNLNTSYTRFNEKQEPVITAKKIGFLYSLLFRTPLTNSNPTIHAPIDIINKIIPALYFRFSSSVMRSTTCSGSDVFCGNNMFGVCGSEMVIMKCSVPLR